jgi:hypothetical protein
MASKAKRRLRRVLAVVGGLAAFVAYLVMNPDMYKNFIPGENYNFFGASQVDLPEMKEFQTTADSFLARDVLEDLAVKEKNTTEKYYRKLFYDNWGMTASGCNTREVVLARDLKNVVSKGCKVQSGTLEDPYTGKTIEFTRGQETSSEVQIDHVVALSNAWSTGAYLMDEETRYEISQDPLNLLAVDGPANQEKSDGDAAMWLPSNESFRCEYVARQISVKYKYQLWVTPEEKHAMQAVLVNCPTEPTVGLED